MQYQAKARVVPVQSLRLAPPRQKFIPLGWKRDEETSSSIAFPALFDSRRRSKRAAPSGRRISSRLKNGGMHCWGLPIGRLLQGLASSACLVQRDTWLEEPRIHGVHSPSSRIKFGQPSRRRIFSLKARGRPMGLLTAWLASSLL